MGNPAIILRNPALSEAIPRHLQSRKLLIANDVVAWLLVEAAGIEPAS